jgi:hypothetical protein
MSNDTNTGGPAFPAVKIISGDNYNPPTKLYHGGMTMRDYFAAKAMQSLITVQFQTKQAQSAETAYEWSDAMIKARNQ